MGFAVCFVRIAMLATPGPNPRNHCHRETTTDPAGLGKNNQWRMHVVRIRTVRCSETGRHARRATQHVEINARRDAKQDVSRLFPRKAALRARRSAAIKLELKSTGITSVLIFSFFPRYIIRNLYLEIKKKKSIQESVWKNFSIYRLMNFP